MTLDPHSDLQKLGLPVPTPPPESARASPTACATGWRSPARRARGPARRPRGGRRSRRAHPPRLPGQRRDDAERRRGGRDGPDRGRALHRGQPLRGAAGGVGDGRAGDGHGRPGGRRARGGRARLVRGRGPACGAARHPQPARGRHRAALACSGRCASAGDLPPNLILKVSVLMPVANPAAARAMERLGAGTLNVTTDLSPAQLGELRQATSAAPRRLRRGARRPGRLRALVRGAGR